MVPEVIDRWLARLPSRVTAAGGNARPILVDSLGTFLEQLADALAPGSTRGDATEGSSIPEEHGSQRVRLTHYRLDDLNEEYHLLREVILESLSAEAPLSPEEHRVITASIDEAIVHASAAYMTAQLTARERLVAEVAHDLRHPLQAIHASATLLSKAPASPDAPRWAERILAGVQSADRMLRDLLDASRIDAGHALQLDLDEIDFVEVVRQAVARQGALHGPRFVLQAPDAVRGRGSADALGRALDNLLANAVKYGATDTPVTVTVAVASSGSIVTLAVHNHGSYVDAGEREAIFQAFHRADRAAQAGVHGWGIGLSIVRGVAEAHGGGMGLESDPVRGTTFYLHVPLDAGAARSPPAPAAGAPS